MNYTEEINKWIEKNRDTILERLSGLIQISTENLPPTGNEKRGQEYIYDWLTGFIPKENIDFFEIDDVPGIREHPDFFTDMDGMERQYKDRPIISVRRPGKGGAGRTGAKGKSLLFSGHMDTMPASGQKWNVFEDPFSGRIQDGKMYGRGAMDMKAGTLAGFEALRCLDELGIELLGDCYAESVIDEENGGVNGTIAARLRNPHPDFAVLGEPTGLTAGIETIGGTDYKAVVKEEGTGGIGFGEEIPNPVYKVAKLAIALEKYDRERRKRTTIPDTYPDDTFLRLLTYQIASGGTSYLESGSIPTEGHLYFWIETFAHMDHEVMEAEMIDFLKKELSQYPDFDQSFPEITSVIRILHGHKTDVEHPGMESVRKAFSGFGIPYKQHGLDIACDAFAFKKVTDGGTDVVVLGPKGGNPHGTDEYVAIESFFSLLKIMIMTAIDFCG
jgi:acetylornithine deacetylase